MSSSSAFKFGTSDPDAPFEFEDIPYPSQHWSAVSREEELPLHYMSEEKARRRVKVPRVDASPHKEKNAMAITTMTKAKTFTTKCALKILV